jgi:alpha-mannosidase
VIAGACPVEPLVRVEVPGALVSAVKRADDGSGELVVRVWESRGGRAAGRIVGREPWVAATHCDLLEDAVEPVPIGDDGAAHVTLRPFEVATVRVRESG